MADWEHLPYEVLQLILGFLPSSKYVYPCLFVCKNWHRTARHGIFRHLHFGSNLQLSDYLQAVKREENRSCGLVAESIDIKKLFYFSAFMPITQLLSKCANVKKINYIGDSENYRLITSLLARHKLQHLEYLPAPDGYSLKEYIACAFQMRSQLKELKLSEAPTLSHSTHAFTVLYGQMDQFVKLEALHLQKASDLDQLDSLIDSCPALKELDLKLRKPPSPRQLESDAREESAQVENAIDYTKLKPQLTVCTAKFKLHTILQKHVEYVLHKFPKLTSLHLAPLASIGELAPTYDPVVVSNGVMLSFLLALSKMHLVYIPFQFEMNDALDTIAKFFVVSNFDGALEVSYQLVVSTKYQLDNPLISYSSDPLKRRINLQYYKGLTQESQPLRGPTVMPHLTLVEVVGAYIKQLVINGMSNKFISGTVNAYYLVDYTLIRCPFLKHMGFIQCDLSYYPLEILPIPHIFMESLRFDDCLLHCPSFIKLSFVMPRLKRLVMKDYQFSSYLAKRQSNGSTRRSVTLNFPFTHFDLFRFKDIRQYRLLSKIYLKLTTDGETTYTTHSRDQQESTPVITEKAFYAPKVESDSLHIDISCKSMKEFKMN